ncbi:immunodominant antigen [Angomonas deanei]|uniref:Uncharacterized protein n=1 Tax=Angomonas deanei TaxID=59799 RepID=A0A7G2CJU4_9TRYP|nr:immunodominant antigen [Angomonas deanei]CAD2219327.1 hypothetical protein, conserved [Angomonas deanei]|eukprot:EPY34488.1 immunodominant antigen [Angomonas deanei]
MLAVFNNQANLALVAIPSDNDAKKPVKGVWCTLNSQVERPGSVCFHHTSDRNDILVDGVTLIELYQINSKSTPVPVAPDTPNTVVKKLPASLVHADPSIVAATPAEPTYPAPTTTESRGPAPTMAPVVPASTVAAVQQAKATLLNNMLLQMTDGPIAAAIYQGDEAFRKQLESQQNVMQNILQIMQLTPQQISRDHQLLVNLALEAQMTELQQTLANQPRGEGTGVVRSASEKSNEDSFVSYAVASLMVPISKDIATGVTRGINETLRSELDLAVKQALGDHLKESQKNIIKKRLDDALRNSTDFFAQEVQKKLQSFATHELKDALSSMNGTIAKLSEENRALQIALRDMMALNTGEELARVRQQVRELRTQLGEVSAVNAAVGTKSSFQARPTPDAVRDAVQAHLRTAHYSEALQYLVLGQHPAVVYEVLFDLDEEHYNALLADANVSDTLWTQTLLILLKHNDGKEATTVQIAQVVSDVISERPALSKPSNAEGSSSSATFVTSLVPRRGRKAGGKRALKS